MPFTSDPHPDYTTGLSGRDNPFPALMQQAHVAIVETDATGRFTRANRRWLEMVGYDEQEILELSVNDVTHPDSQRETREANAQLALGGSQFVLEKKYLRKDGSSFWASTTVSALRDAQGRFRGCVALVLDRTEERRSRRIVEGQNEALQLIISGLPLAEVFASLIAAIESESGGEAVASVLLYDARTGRLRHGAAPGLPEAYNQAIDGLLADPGVGTCAAAAALNRVVITPDIETDPGWRDYKHLPLGLGLRAAWSMPIAAADGHVLGTFGTYFRRSRRPSESEIAAVAMMARTAALAIERREAEESLRAATGETDRQRRLYETVLSTTPDLVYVFDRQHRFAYANAALLAMWGRTWDESVGRRLIELGYEPWHAEMHDREIDQVIATKQPVRGVVAFNGTNGRRFYDYIFAPVIGASGEVEAIAGTTRDVTDQRKIAVTVRFLADLTQELALMRDEAAIIRHTVSAVGRHLGAHRCYFVECFEAVNRITVSENWVRDNAPSLAGRFSLFDFGGAEWWREYAKGDFAVDDTATSPLINPAAAANYAALGVRSYAVQPFKRSERWTTVLAVTDDHPRRWNEGELRLLEDVVARVWPLVERARSDAALRIARDEALAASRAKDDFIAALSHELRTPLNPVLLLASERAADPAMAPEVRADFATIVRNVSLEARLIDDLLDLSRITHDKLALKPRAVDVHALLHHALDATKLDQLEKQLELKVELGADAATVHGDDLRLQQIFVNLLRNAVKFTAPGGCITVATSRSQSDPGRLVIEVTDTGIGLTAAELAKIFTPFAQGEHSEPGTASPYGGLGLGLAISRQIAELHGGTIRVRSAGRDQGATFRVELPLMLERPPEPVAPVAPEPDRGLPREQLRRILLVEDHEPSRVALARLLKNRKIEVVHAASAREALAKAQTETFDLVISDLGLPDSSGYDLMIALRERHGCRGIALSGYGTQDDVARSLQAGFLTHLTKPVQVNALDRALQQFCRP